MGVIKDIFVGAPKPKAQTVTREVINQPVAPPPTVEDAGVAQAGIEELKRARARRGRAATVLTGEGGLGSLGPVASAQAAGTKAVLGTF